MWSRGLGACAWIALAAAIAFACKRDDDAIKQDETKPKKKHVVDPPPKKLPAPKEHRAEHTPCSRADTPAPKAVTYGPRMPTPPGPPCTSKADCTARANGRCAAGHCTYDRCYEDKDCGAGVCTCQQEGEHGYYCKPGDCAVDADCGATGYCSPTWSMHCGAFLGVVGYYCRTAKDECVNHDDCKKGSEQGYCAYDPEQKHWRCGFGHCVG